MTTSAPAFTNPLTAARHGRYWHRRRLSASAFMISSSIPQPAVSLRCNDQWILQVDEQRCILEFEAAEGHAGTSASIPSGGSDGNSRRVRERPFRVDQWGKYIYVRRSSVGAIGRGLGTVWRSIDVARGARHRLCIRREWQRALFVAPSMVAIWTKITSLPAIDRNDP